MKKVISTTKAPAAIGPYSQAIEANGFVFASGQIPVDPETGVIPEGIEAQAEQVMKNMKNLLEAAGTSIDQVVKTSAQKFVVGFFKGAADGVVNKLVQPADLGEQQRNDGKKSDGEQGGDQDFKDSGCGGVGAFSLDGEAQAIYSGKA